MILTVAASETWSSVDTQVARPISSKRPHWPLPLKALIDAYFHVIKETGNSAGVTEDKSSAQPGLPWERTSRNIHFKSGFSSRAGAYSRR